MNKQELKEFLEEKPGYLKEGAIRFHNLLFSRGLISKNITVDDVAEVLSESRKEFSFRPTDIKEAKILFYDIEVSYGLARVWRPGWKVRVSYDDFEVHPKIICISYKWNNSDEVFTVQWDENQDDKTLLEEFIPVLQKADFIVGHNGDKFDLPWVRSRALVHNIPMLPKYASVDTLKQARYNFRFPSNRLDDLGDYLGLGRKIKTDRQLWVDVVTNKDSKALDRMIEYCEQDVFLLEDVYNKLSEQMLPGVHAGTLNGKDKTSSPYTGGQNLIKVKTRTTRAGTKKHMMKCLDTNKYFEMSNRAYENFRENK